MGNSRLLTWRALGRLLVKRASNNVTRTCPLVPQARCSCNFDAALVGMAQVGDKLGSLGDCGGVLVAYPTVTSRSFCVTSPIRFQPNFSPSSTPPLFHPPPTY